MKQLVCLLIVLAIVQTNGLHLVLDPYEKFNVTVDKNETWITFTISAETTGWVGIGFSPNGAMTDSDIIIGWVDNNGTGFVRDYFASHNGAPTLDTSQDVELLSASESNGITTIEFTRMILSTDTYDRSITQDTTRLIYGYGNSDLTDFTSLGYSEYHGSTQRGVKSVYLLDYAPPAPALLNDIMEWTAAPSNITVPSKSTTYWCTYHRQPTLNAKHHVLKFSPFITAGNEAAVHHMLLYQCNGVTDADVQAVGGGSHECYGQNMPEFTGKCGALVFGWAVGGGDTYAPAEAGLPIGDTEDGIYFLLETHFDNPQQRSDVVDSSGIILTYSPTLRENDFGIMYVGSVAGLFIPPEAERFSVYGYCDSACTDDLIPESGVTVFGHNLHAHTAGVGIKVEIKRKGEDERSVLVSDLKYDFNFQEFRPVYPTFKIYPGDELKVTCMMTTTGRQDPTWGGLATSDEMCLAFLSYYPKTRMGKCENYAAYLLDLNSTIYEYLDVKPYRYPSSRYTNFGELMTSITWDADKIENAQKGVGESAYYTRCLLSSGDETESSGRRVPVVDEETSAATPITSSVIFLISIISILNFMCL